MRVEKVAFDATAEEAPPDHIRKRSGGPRKNKLTAAEFDEIAGRIRALHAGAWASRKRQLLLAAMEDEKLPRSAVRVLERLLDYANQAKHGYAFVHIESLAMGKGPERKRLAERTVHNSLRALEEGGYIAIQRRHKGTQRCSLYHFPPIASGIMPGDEGPGSDCKTDCTAMQSADCKVEENQTATAMQSQREPILLNPSKENQGSTALPERAADVGDVPLDDGQERPAQPPAHPFGDALLPSSMNDEPLRQVTAALTGKAHVPIDGKILQIEPSLKVLAHKLCVDLEAIVARVEAQIAAGAVIKDLNAYIAQAIYNEASKRSGIPIESLRRSIDRDPKVRAAAFAEAVGTPQPTRSVRALSPAKSDTKALLDALDGVGRHVALRRR